MQSKMVAYRRVSTARQGQSGLGLEGQEVAIAQHVRASGSTVLASYLEVESGKRSDRPELVKALAHARRSGATLVIAKLDRLSRNVAFLSALMESKVAFVACDNANASPLTLHILAAVAEDEVKRISERTKTALAAYKARGGVLGKNNLTEAGRILAVKNAAVSHAKRANAASVDLLPIVLHLKGQGLTLRAIAETLNNEGHSTRQHKPFTHVQVMRLLARAPV